MLSGSTGRATLIMVLLLALATVGPTSAQNPPMSLPGVANHAQVGAVVAAPYFAGPGVFTGILVTNTLPTDAMMHVHVLDGDPGGSWGERDFFCGITPNETTLLLLADTGTGPRLHVECSPELGIEAGPPLTAGLVDGQPGSVIDRPVDGNRGVVVITEVLLNDPGTTVTTNNRFIADWTTLDVAAGTAINAEALQFQAVAAPLFGIGDAAIQFGGSGAEVSGFPLVLGADFIAPTPGGEIVTEVLLLTLDGKEGTAPRQRVDGWVYNDDEIKQSWPAREWECMDHFSLTDLDPGFVSTELCEDAPLGCVGHIVLNPAMVSVDFSTHDTAVGGYGNGDQVRQSVFDGYIIHRFNPGAALLGAGPMADPGATVRLLSRGTGRHRAMNGDRVVLDLRAGSADTPPTAVADAVALAEDAPATWLDVLANDTDPDGGPKAVGLVTQPANGTVVITGAGSGITYQPNPDYCNDGAPTDDFTYTLAPGGSVGTVQMTVTCVDDPPVAVDDLETVVEDAPAAAIGVLGNDTDVDGGPISISSVTQPPNGAVLITGGGTGLSYQPDAGFCNDGTPTDDFTYTLSPGGSVGTVAVTVTCVNDPPSFTKGADETVLEDAGAQTVAGWATAVSPGPASEAGQTLTFNVTGNTNMALFAAGPAVDSSGQLTYTPAANANGSATITLELMDDGGTANGGVDTSPPQMFTINVTPVNDEPSFTKGADETVLEDAGVQSVPGWATALSSGPADEAGQTLSFNVTNNTNMALFAVNPAIDSSGELTYTPADDANGSATITLELMDDGGTANGGDDTSAPQMFVIDVTPVNDVPSFTKGADEAVLEDAGAQTVAGWATGISPGPTNEVGQTLTFNVTGNTNMALFAAGPAVDSSGQLTYTPAADANGAATITLELMDDGGTANGGVDTSAAQMFDIVVTAVNDPPSFTKGADETVLEDAGAQTVPGWATALSPGPADEAGQTLSFTVTGNTNMALFAVNPAIDPSGELTYTPADDANGSATITLELMDNGGTANGGVDTSASQMFVIDVTPVNDVPSFTKGADETVLEDAGAQTVAGWATVLSPGPVDEAGQTLSFNITNNTNMALFAVNPAVDSSGELTYTPAADANGSATITLEVMDDGGTANGGVDTSATQMFDINVTPVNDPPSFSKGPNQVVVDTDGAQSVAGWAMSISRGPADESGQTLSFLVSNDNNGLFDVQPDVDETTGELSYTPKVGASGVANVDVALMDNGGGADTSAIQSFTITVQKGPVAAPDPGFTAVAPLSVPDGPMDLLANDVLGLPAATLASFGGGSLPGDATSNAAGALVNFGTGGSLQVNADGSFDFTPATGSSGSFTFSYRLSNVVASSDALVTIALTAPPSAVDDPGFNVVSGVLLSPGAGALFTNDDLGVPAATVASFGGGSLAGDASTNAAGATVNFGTGSLQVNADGGFMFTSDTNFSGDFTFQYRLDNGAGTSDALVTIEVRIAPAAVDDTVAGGSSPGDPYHTALDAPLNIPDGATDLLANDTLGVPAAVLASFGGGSLAGDASTNAAGSTVNFGTGGSLQVNADGTLSFTPETGFTGLFSFDYRLTNVVNSSDATVTLAVGVRPATMADSLSVLANVRVDTSLIPLSVLTNDSGDNLTITAFGTGGPTGDVVQGAGGQFTYDPLPGSTSADSFGYTISNGFGTANGTVNVTVSGPAIWFVDASAAGPGDGRLSDPFKCLVGATCFHTVAADAAGDFIFLADGSYGAGLTLLATQSIVGDGSSSTLAAIAGATPPAGSLALPGFSGTDPLISGTGDGITLGSDNLVRGLTVGSTTGTGITGTGVGNLGITETSVSGSGRILDLDGGGTIGVVFDSLTSTSSSGGPAIDVSGVGGSFTVLNLGGTDTSIASATSGISVQGSSGASFTFGDTSVGSSGTGIDLGQITNNSGATFSFDSLAVASTGGAGLLVDDSGTLNISGTGNIASAVGDSAVSIVDTAIGVGGITFLSVDASGGSSPGLELVNTGSQGFTVSGDGATGTGLSANNGSGGTITGMTVDCVLLDDVNNVSLNYMDITDCDDNGVDGTDVNGFVLTRSNVTGHGDGGSAEAPLFFRGLTGTADGSGELSGGTHPTLIANSVIADGDEDNVQIKNETGTLARLEVRDSTIGSMTFGAGCSTGTPAPCRNSNDGINFEGLSTGPANAVMNLRVEDSIFIGNGGDHVNPFHNGTGGSMDIDIIDNMMTDTQSNPLGVGGGITIAANDATSGSGATVTYDVAENEIEDAVLVAIDTNLIISGAGMLMEGKIRDNVIGRTGAGITECGSGSFTGVGIRTRGNRAGTHTVAITGNTIRNWTNGGGITVLVRDGTGTLNATVTGNTEVMDAGCVAAFVAFGSGLHIESGAISGDTNTLCIDAGGAGGLSNTLVEPNGFDPSVLVLQNFTTTMRFPTYAGAATNPTAHTDLNTFLGGRNSLGANGVAADPSQGPTFQGGITTGVSGGAPTACPQP